jgi:hypothetical protein
MHEPFEREERELAIYLTCACEAIASLTRPPRETLAGKVLRVLSADAYVFGR